MPSCACASPMASTRGVLGRTYSNAASGVAKARQSSAPQGRGAGVATGVLGAASEVTGAALIPGAPLATGSERAAGPETGGPPRAGVPAAHPERAAPARGSQQSHAVLIQGSYTAEDKSSAASSYHGGFCHCAFSAGFSSKIRRSDKGPR